MTVNISLHEVCVRVGVRYVITKFSRMDSLPNFLTHGAPQARASRARELRYYITLVAILTACLFRQNKFNIYFNYHSDADECLNNSHNCSENATCTNIEGSFNCSCKPGYIGNGHNCSGWFLEFLSRFPLVLRLVGFSTIRVNVQQCTFINSSKL